MAQMAMRIRHRQQNPPASPQEGARWVTVRPLGNSVNPEPFSVFRRLAGQAGVEQQPLNLSSPLY